MPRIFFVLFGRSFPLKSYATLYKRKKNGYNNMVIIYALMRKALGMRRIANRSMVKVRRAVPVGNRLGAANRTPMDGQ